MIPIYIIYLTMGKKGDNKDNTPKNIRSRRKHQLKNKNDKKKKKCNTSDDDRTDSDDSEWLCEEDDIEDTTKIQKIISKMFPSKTNADKQRQLKAIDKMKKKDKKEKINKKRNKKKREKNNEHLNQLMDDGEDERFWQEMDIDNMSDFDLESALNGLGLSTSGTRRTQEKRLKKNIDGWVGPPHVSETEEDEEEEDEEEYDFEEEDDSEYDSYLDEEEEIKKLKENMKFNIIFTIGDKNSEHMFEDDYYDEFYENGECYDEEDDSCSDVYKDTEDETAIEDDEENVTIEDDNNDKQDVEEEIVENKIISKKQLDIDKPVLLSEKNATKKNAKKKNVKKKVSDSNKKNQTNNKKTKSKKKTQEFKLKDRVEVKLREWDTYYPGTIIKVNNKKKKTNRPVTYDIELDDDSLEILKNVKYKNDNIVKMMTEEDEILEYGEVVNELKELVKAKKLNGTKGFMKKIDDMVKYTNEKQKKLDDKNAKKKQLSNVKKFRKLISDNNVMNDYKYFKSLDVDDQSKIIRKLREVKKFTKIEKPYRITLIESEIPVEFKSCALKKIDTLEYMDPGSGEYYKIKHWIDGFMQIPFNRYNNLPVKISDGTELCNRFMEDSKRILDECVYGLDDAKMQIMQMIGQWISNPDSIGTAIAIKGPPGTGKTTLVKEGISKILNRPFAFLALGGATDSSFLEGHSYTYEGSNWGKIVDIIINCKSMNPVIYFDELDKISDTPKGEEITGILTHLTDTTQNSQFHDKYFSSIDFNLSKCMFIFSYNIEEKINPILKDRMYRIETKGYGNSEKTIIAKNYLIPKIEKNINFKSGDIIISDDIITHICDKYTNKEKGVRNLKRALEIIYTKLNLYRLMKKGSSLFGKEETIDVKFPFTVTTQIVDKLIKFEDKNKIPFGMYL